MKIGIIDADLIDNGTRHPNLACMKLSGYYKDLGNNVNLKLDYKKLDEYDKVVISKVFTDTSIDENILKLDNVSYGGTGFFFDKAPNLSYEIEHHMPDYHLYDDFINEKLRQGSPRSHYADYLDYSIGFTTRGCFRKCEFCVNKRYDKVQLHSPVSEFLDIKRPKIYLWDDNFLAFSRWYSVLDELESTKKPFQFRQGLDVRLMTEEKAERLSKVKYSGDYIFAFDYIEDKELIEKKLALWKKYCKKTTKLYVLTGYKSQDILDIIETFERIKILMSYGCLPYIMRYEDYKNSKFKGMYIQIARWCNQPAFFKKKSFREFCEANQKYHKNPNTLCSAYKVMIEFEKSFPNIANKYFDLKFDKLRMF